MRTQTLLCKGGASHRHYIVLAGFPGTSSNLSQSDINQQNNVVLWVSNVIVMVDEFVPNVAKMYCTYAMHY